MRPSHIIYELALNDIWLLSNCILCPWTFFYHVINTKAGRIPSWNTEKGSGNPGDGGQNENIGGAAPGKVHHHYSANTNTKTNTKTHTTQLPKDYQRHIAVLKESLCAKEEHYNMLQADVEELRARLEEKNRLLEKKTQGTLQTVQERNRLTTELTELKDHMEIKDRKISVLQRKVSRRLPERVANFLNILIRLPLKYIHYTCTSHHCCTLHC